MNWHDLRRTDAYEWEMLDPWSLSSRGYLKGVVGGSLTKGYYTELREQGNMSIGNASDWIDNSLVRIYHKVEREGYRRCLGTYFAEFDSRNIDAGTSMDIKLYSMLYRFADDFIPWRYAVAQGELGRDTFASLCKGGGAPYQIDAAVAGYRATATKVYDFGTSVLSVLYDLADNMSARIGCDPYGTIMLYPYVEPALKTPLYTIDPYAKNSLVISDIVEGTSLYSTSNRVGVEYADGDAVVFDADGWAPSSWRGSRAQRGRVVTNIVKLDELSPQTYRRAQEIANERAAALASGDFATYEFSMRYLPLDQGDVVAWPWRGQIRKCLVQEVELSLSAGMVQRVKLKEVA